MKAKIKIFLPIAVCITLLAAIAYPSCAQDKGKVRLDINYFQIDNGLPTLNTLVRTRIDRRYEPVEGVDVKYYLNEIDENSFLGSTLTDPDGRAIFQLSESFKPIWDTTNVFTFYAVLVDDPNYEDADDDVEVSKARMTMELLEDEGKQLKVVVNKYLEDGSLEPATEVSLIIKVKRTFGFLKIGDDSYETDDNGEVVVDFPDDIPGGMTGELTIIASIDDNDDFGNLQIKDTAKWGTQIANEDFFAERSLWAKRDRAPYWLLIFPNLIIIGIWGTLIYLVYLIFRIKRMGRL